MNNTRTEYIAQGYHSYGEHPGWRTLGPDDADGTQSSSWAAREPEAFEAYRTIRRVTETQVFESLWYVPQTT